MGVYDTVRVPCPKCGEKADFQSKSGDCILSVYELNECPSDVLYGLQGYTHDEICGKCGTLFSIFIHVRGIPFVIQVTDKFRSENKMFKFLGKFFRKNGGK